MKKIITILGATLLTLVIMTSCGHKKEITLPNPPTDIKYEGVSLIDGPLSGYIEVVPGSYLLELVKNESEFLLGYEGTMKVKFKFIKSIDVKAGTGYNQYGPSLNGKAIDEQGAPLDFELSVMTDKDLATYLKRGSGEEWLTLNIFGQGTCKDLAEAELQLAKYKKGKKIRFNSEIVEEKFDSESSSSSSSNSESATSSNVDCDEYLKGYEKFMNDYIDILKKYKKNPTDASILAKYTTIMSEATEWSTKTADCASDTKFAEKFSKIQMKIANAASGM
ncbi:MAG: DUF6591 domain-containing protein [Bacteroidales bacterium]